MVTYPRSGARMTVWIRESPRSALEELTMAWHLEAEPSSITASRGLIAAECGWTVAVAVAVASWAGDGPAPMDSMRCPACQAHAKGGEA
jgi:hypothetical protein